MPRPAYAVESVQAALLMDTATGVKKSGAAVLKMPPTVNDEGPGRSCSHACMGASMLMHDMRLQSCHTQCWPVQACGMHEDKAHTLFVMQ